MKIDLFTKGKIGNITPKNRIVLPPMVRFSLVGKDGKVTKELLNWYDDIASRGVGMIIVEATCVSKDGKLRDNQIGIWDDSFIEGLSEIVKVCDKYRVPTIIQLHHKGFKEAIKDVSKDVLDSILDDFVEGIKRSKRCGFHGVELHGAHTYLLSQLNSALWNKREDEYGGSFEKRMTFNRVLIERTRDLFDDDFILGYRMGGNEPTLEEGIRVAKYLESLGVDILHVSSGVPDPSYKCEEKIEIPRSFPLDWVVYLGVEIKKHVDIPVIGVRKIKKEYQGSWLIEEGLLDYVGIGRGFIAKPHWVEEGIKEFNKRKEEGHGVEELRRLVYQD